MCRMSSLQRYSPSEISEIAFSSLFIQTSFMLGNLNLGTTVTSLVLVGVVFNIWKQQRRILLRGKCLNGLLLCRFSVAGSPHT